MTKRIILIIAIIAFMFITIGATTQSDSYNKQFIRTTYRDDTEIKTILSSKEELNAFYEKYKDTLYLEHREKVYVDSTIGFFDAIEKYDEEYFKGNNLIIIYITEPSGSITHDIKNISIKDNTIEISISQKSSEYLTCDMAGWLLILEIENTHEIITINYTKSKN